MKPFQEDKFPMENERFREALAQHTADVEAVLQKFLPTEQGYEKTVIEAMNYSVAAGGKRLRPMFILAVSQMYQGRKELYEPFMAALEMIHTYSLVHDDLPAMDNDEYRRGQKTTWNVYGEDMAVLAGDGLLNLAYETALRSFHQVISPSENVKIIHALEVLSKNAGIYGMVGGQCADIETDKHPDTVTEDTLLYIHRNKTACLIDSGLTIGAILAGASDLDVQKLSRIALNIGLAFQIQDDILDVIGTKEELGKSIGKDALEGKVTYVTMHGLEKAKEKVKALTEESLQLFDTLAVPAGDEEADFLRTLLESLITRKK